MASSAHARLPERPTREHVPVDGYLGPAEFNADEVFDLQPAPSASAS